KLASRPGFGKLDSTTEGGLSRKSTGMHPYSKPMAGAPAHLRLVRRARATPATDAALGTDTLAGDEAGSIRGLDDAKLVALASKGELAAFEALYRRHAAFAI